MNRLTDSELLDIAKSRAEIAARIESEAAAEGKAVGIVRFKFGVVARRPGKKRGATSGCSKDSKRDHGRISLVPTVSEAAQVQREPPVIIGGRNSKGQPFKGTVIVRGALSPAAIKESVAKREKMIQKIIAGK